MVDQDVLAQREALAVTSNACLPHLLDERGAIPVIILEWTGIDDLGFPMARCLVQAPDDPRGYTERSISISCLNRGM